MFAILPWVCLFRSTAAIDYQSTLSDESEPAREPKTAPWQKGLMTEPSLRTALAGRSTHQVASPWAGLGVVATTVRDTSGMLI